MLPSLSPASLSKKRDPLRESRFCPTRLLRAPRWDRGVGLSLGLLDLVDSIADEKRRLSGSSAMLAFWRAVARLYETSRDPGEKISS
jgi:hypothetical protein